VRHILSVDERLVICERRDTQIVPNAKMILVNVLLCS